MKQRSQDRSWAQSIWNPVGRGGGGGGGNGVDLKGALLESGLLLE